MGRHLEVLPPRNHTFAVANKCRYFLAIDYACAIPDRITSANAKSRVFILISLVVPIEVPTMFLPRLQIH